MKKIFLILGIGLLALIIVISIAVGLYIGPIVKMGIEQVGPKVTQVPVLLDGVDLALGTGSVTLKGLTVGNPQGYSAAQAFKAGTIAVSLVAQSVLSDKIVVHAIHVESPEITYEGGLGGNNLSKILSNVNTFIKNNIPQSDKPAPKIEVDDFLMTGAIVHVNVSGLVSKDIPLPQIHLTDLGKDGNGITPAELTRAVLKVISVDTVTAVASSAGGIGKLGGNISQQITSGLSGLLGK